MKTCTKCGEAKPLTAFAKSTGHKSAKSGLRPCCKDCCNAWSREWRAQNPDKMKAARTKWSEENPGADKERCAKWRAENPDKNRAKASKNRAARIQRTPPWADHGKINAVYAEQQRYLELGIEVHVDHIVPLQGELASGLHTHDNLQLLLAPDNCGKKNKLPDDPMAIVPTWKLLKPPTKAL